MTQEQPQVDEEVALRFDVDDVLGELSAQLAAAMKDNAILRASLRLIQREKQQQAPEADPIGGT